MRYRACRSLIAVLLATAGGCSAARGAPADVSALGWNPTGLRKVAAAAKGIPRGVITASGSGGQRLAILPSIDTVVVHLVDTERRGGPRVTTSEFDGLLRRLLAARVDSELATSDR